MLKYVEIDKSLFETAKRIQNEIFPEHDATKNYEEAILRITDNKYYLISDENTGEYVGISGLYSLPSDPSSAWLGWFGILYEHRRKHYGSEALRLFEEEARKLGYLYCRLYADRFDNDATLLFYEKNGYIFEEYSNRSDPGGCDFPILIGGKSVSQLPLEPWNSRNIGLTLQLFKQMGFVPRRLAPKDLDAVTALYKDCFMTNEYFAEQFGETNIEHIMDTSFRDMFRYCIGSGYSFGIFRGDDLIAFSLCFDFYELKETNPRQFNNVFTSDYDNTDYPYQTEFHGEVDKLKKPVMYVLAVAVRNSERGEGIASRLVDNVILEYGDRTIMSDVTSPSLLGIFRKRGFDISRIDDGYSLVYRET